MAIRSQNTMIQLCQDLFHSTHASQSHRHSSHIHRAPGPTASACSSVSSHSPFALKPMLDRRRERSSKSPHTPSKWSPRRKHRDRFSPKRLSPRLPPKPSPIATTSGIPTQRSFSPLLVFISPHHDHAHATRPSSNALPRVVVKERHEPSGLGTDTASLEKGVPSFSKDILKRPVRSVYPCRGEYTEWHYYCSSVCDVLTNDNYRRLSHAPTLVSFLPSPRMIRKMVLPLTFECRPRKSPRLV